MLDFASPRDGEFYTLHPTVPFRVQAAMKFVEICKTPNDDSVPRQTTEAETRALDAALTVMRYYFTGEMEYTELPRFVDLPARKPLPQQVAASRKTKVPA